MASISAVQTSLSTVSSSNINYYDRDGIISSAPQYAINGILSSQDTVKNNLDRIIQAAGAWMTYDYLKGKWKVIPNTAVSALAAQYAFVFDDKNIISDINLSTTPLESLYNAVEIEFPSRDLKGEVQVARVDWPAEQRSDYEPDNVLKLRIDMIDDSVRAQRLANIYLRQAREDLNIEFTSNFKGLVVEPGDVVKVTNDVFGWNAKLFRVMSVSDICQEDGNLVARIKAIEYNADVYSYDEINEFQLAPNTDIPWFYDILSPSQPILVAYNYFNDTPYFTLETTIPAGNPVNELEFWLSVDNNVYNWYSSTTADFEEGDIIPTDFRGLDTGIYYIKCRTKQNNKYSEFSEPTILTWIPETYRYDYSALITAYKSHSPYPECFPATMVINKDSGGDNIYTNEKLSLQLNRGLENATLATSSITTDDGMSNNTWRIVDAQGLGLTTGAASYDYNNNIVSWTVTGLTLSQTIFKVVIRWKDNAGVVSEIKCPPVFVFTRALGFDAPDGKQLKLVSSNKIFNENPVGEVGQNFSPTTIRFTTLKHNLSNTPSWAAYDSSGNTISLTTSGSDRILDNYLIDNLSYIRVVVWIEEDNETYIDCATIYRGEAGTIKLISKNEFITIPHKTTDTSQINDWEVPQYAYISYVKGIDSAATVPAFANSGDTTDAINLSVYNQINTRDLGYQGIVVNNSGLKGQITPGNRFKMTKDLSSAEISSTAASPNAPVFYMKSRNGVGGITGTNPEDISEVVINTNYPAFWNNSANEGQPYYIALVAQTTNLTTPISYTWSYKREADGSYTTYRTNAGPLLILTKDEYTTILGMNSTYIDFKVVADDNSAITYDNRTRIRYMPDHTSGHIWFASFDNQLLNIAADGSSNVTGDLTLLTPKLTVWGGLNGGYTQDTTAYWSGGDQFSIVSQTGISGATINADTGQITFGTGSAMSANEGVIVARWSGQGGVQLDATLTIKKQIQP